VFKNIYKKGSRIDCDDDDDVRDDDDDASIRHDTARNAGGTGPRKAEKDGRVEEGTWFPRVRSLSC